METFRFTNSLHLLNIFYSLVSLTGLILSIIWSWEIVLIIMFALGTALTLFGLFNCLYTKYVIDDKNLLQKTLLKTRVIKLDSVEQVYRLSNSKRDKIVIYGSGTTIYINYWISDYKQLLQILVDRCIENEFASIDKNVIELLRA